MSTVFLQVFFLKFLRQLNHFSAQVCHFCCLLFQFKEVSRCLFLGEISVQYLHDLVIVHADRPELAVKFGELCMKIDCIHVNLYGLYCPLKDAGGNKMCHYVHARLLKPGQELRIFRVVQTNRIAVDSRVILALATTFADLISFVVFHISNPL